MEKTNESSAFSKNHYTAIIKEEGNWWIGWVEEIPGVNCQEATREELLDSLKVTLTEALELNRQDALLAADSGFETESIVL
jgi:predicted RNase H-like HicB family nuclease